MPNRLLPPDVADAGLLSSPDTGADGLATAAGPGRIDRAPLASTGFASPVGLGDVPAPRNSSSGFVGSALRIVAGRVFGVGLGLLDRTRQSTCECSCCNSNS